VPAAQTPPASGRGAVVGTPILIDSRFDDWDTVPVALTDPVDAPDGFIDFGELRIASDGQLLHLLLDVGRVVNVQKLDGTVLLPLDVDGDAATGVVQHDMPGVDIIVSLSPPSAARAGEFEGIGVRSMTYAPDPNDPAARPIIPYDIGFSFAPTFASRRVELRIERGTVLPQTPTLMASEQVRGRLVFLGRDGQVVDSTDVFQHDLVPLSVPVVAQPNDPLARPEGESLRVVSWNAELGAILDRPEPFIRVLRALDPDVILLQELRDTHSGDEVAAFLNEHLAGASRSLWQVVFGEGGGDLRCAVASRVRMLPAEALRLVPYPERPDRHVRIAGAYIGYGSQVLLAASIHLKCCGRIGGSEDATRMTEVQAIRQAVATAIEQEDADGLIIGGDLNLVGSRAPLDALMEGLDADGSALAIAEALQIDGRTNATWSDPRQPFVPGRLDWMLCGDSRLACLRTFVLDARDLTTRWLQHHGLHAGDTAASDHLPLVADFQWQPRPQRSRREPAPDGPR
jgi:endonuclease/exonuclease/phosphatase family metal-dependent hydrolase